MKEYLLVFYLKFSAKRHLISFFRFPSRYCFWSYFKQDWFFFISLIFHCCCNCCWVVSVISNTVRPHRRQPPSQPRPWDSPGKSTGVGCHFLLQCMKGKSESEVVQSCLTLRHPMDCSLPGSSVHGSFQARVLEWVAIADSPIWVLETVFRTFVETTGNKVFPHCHCG